MATLRQVLNHFEQQTGAISLNAMARELGVERPMLQEMIDYWVRKGRLREANAGTSCPSSSVCGPG
ncbi:MAG: FeoC-like transcriptional regulator, partial [Anaerolineae bacterium]|nr:FeoC-like transcriptional regulator [Anaerolineae bacterium]